METLLALFVQEKITWVYNLWWPAFKNAYFCLIFIIFALFQLFQLFWMKKHISTRFWRAQNPNAGQNIQQTKIKLLISESQKVFKTIFQQKKVSKTKIYYCLDYDKACYSWLLLENVLRGIIVAILQKHIGACFSLNSNMDNFFL